MSDNCQSQSQQTQQVQSSESRSGNSIPFRHGLVLKKLPALIGDIGAVGKDGENKEQRYAFRKYDDVIDKLQPLLKKHQLSIVPFVVDREESERSTKSGGVMTCTTLTVQFTVFAEDGSFVTGQTVGKSFDTSDKSSNKAHTAAFKVFLTECLCIATQDNKDADEESPQLEPIPARSHGQQLFLDLIEHAGILGIAERFVFTYLKRKGLTADSITDASFDAALIDLEKVRVAWDGKTEEGLIEAFREVFK